MAFFDDKFKANFLLSNRHMQTSYSSLFRKVPQLNFDIENFHLSDGDFLEAYWLKTNKRTNQTPIVILFHGLAGSYKSPYIRAAMIALTNAGFDAVLMHFRGCSGIDNLHAKSYHSGATEDAKEFIQSLHKRFPHSKLFSIAYSLGANMLLKLLGETKENSLLEKAVAISAPMSLDICAKSMNRGFSKFYQHRLLKELKNSLVRKYKKHDMQVLIGLKREDVKKLNTFWEFDDAYTAPIHGFSSAENYYTQCSSKQFLKEIKTPTLIIHAEDDPFMTPEVIPNKNELSEHITLEVSKNGGHVGFIGGKSLMPIYWLEKRVLEYFLS